MPCQKNNDHIPGNTAQRVIVITRLLPTFGQPVITHVELCPAEIPPFENKTSSEMEVRYGEYLMERVKKDFCSKFVEFNSAQWFWSIHPLGEEDSMRFRSNYLPT